MNSNEIIKYDNSNSNNKVEELKLDTKKCLEYMDNIQGSYTFQCKDFCKFVRKNKLDFDVGSIKKYFIHLNNSDYAVNTKNIKRQAVKKVIRDIYQTVPDVKARMEMERILEFLDKDPETKAYKINSHSVTKDKVLNEKEYNKLIKKIDNKTITMFVKFLWTTGCRISEVLNIKLKNISIDKGNAYITILGKGKKERRIFIKVELLKEIQAYFKGKVFLFEKTNGEKYNRVYISTEIKRYAKEILDRNNISDHKIRHSFATRMIEKTNKIQAVSQFLGHSDVAITLSTYTHQKLTPEDMGKELK